MLSNKKKSSCVILLTLYGSPFGGGGGGAPRMIETYCAGTYIAPLFKSLCFLDLSLFK